MYLIVLFVWECYMTHIYYVGKVLHVVVLTQT